MKAEGLTIEERMEILEAGGQFEETGPVSWIGILVRRGDNKGRVIRDLNGFIRDLYIEFENGSTAIIEIDKLNKINTNAHEFEWCDGEWHRF